MMHISPILPLLFAATGCVAVPLDNWRAPFYRIAATREHLSESPSGMFWDNMRGASICAYSLWPDSLEFEHDHWMLEPALRAELGSESFITGDKWNLRLDLRSDFRFDKLSVRTALVVDRTYGSDPEYVWHRKRAAAGRIEEAYLQYHGGRGFIRFGRLNRNWGPFFDRSILLSNCPFSYDAFEWQFRLPFLEFRHLFSAFPRRFSYKDLGNQTTKTNRYLAAHALNLVFGEWGSIGVSEAELFSREEGFPDFQYMNPISIYTVLNTNSEGPGNLMLGFQGWVHPFTKQITLKSQVVFDDFQVDNETAVDQEPAHWAGDFGCYWHDPTPLSFPHHVSLEYTYVSRWMYTVNWENADSSGERYSYLGKGLGYPEIDGDWLKTAFTAVGKEYWAASVGFGIARKDTNNIFTRWERLSGTLGYRKETRLSSRPTLKTTLSVFVDLHGYFRDYCDAHLLFENRWIRDKSSSSFAGFVYDPRILLTFSAHCSDFFVGFRDRSKHDR